MLLASSGSRAFERLDYAAAANLFGRAAALLPAADPVRTGLLADHGFALFELSEFESALAVLGEAAAESADGDAALHWRARAEHERIQIYLDPDRSGGGDPAQADGAGDRPDGAGWGRCRTISIVGAGGRHR